MKSALPWFFVLLGLVAIIIFGLIKLSESSANEYNAQANLEYARGQAQAMVIHAIAESRLTAATATTILSAAMLPWGVLAVLGVLGLAVVSLAFVALLRPPRPVERQIIYLPPPYTIRYELEQSFQPRLQSPMNQRRHE